MKLYRKMGLEVLIIWCVRWGWMCYGWRVPGMPYFSMILCLLVCLINIVICNYKQ